ncbi:hypothetical protein KA047_00280 [Candidatus Saccharibacteria bacterium]|nr:hypothetical protein [Candidatus Saccharibacteria bacterium]
MLTPENCIRLCADCPNREDEGIVGGEPITGDLVVRGARYINARLEFLRDPSESPDVPVQEFGAYFIDSEGNETAPFLPGVQLEDVAACDKPVIAKRNGFLGRKKYYDCGAQAEKMQALRKRVFGS